MQNPERICVKLAMLIIAILAGIGIYGFPRIGFLLLGLLIFVSLISSWFKQDQRKAIRNIK
jgi:hypothetical protein